MPLSIMAVQRTVNSSGAGSTPAEAVMIINLTPHDVKATNSDGEIITFPKGNNPAPRLKEIVCPAFQADGFNVNFVEMVPETDLPEPQQGVYYIVPKLIQDAFPERCDLLSPGKIERKPDGTPDHCKGFYIPFKQNVSL